MTKFFTEYLSNILPVSFNFKNKDKIIKIGHEEPLFTVNLKKEIKKRDLLSSTSLALGEAYMQGNIDVDKDLYEVLDLLLGQMNKFIKEESSFKKILFTSTSKHNQKKEVTSHYDIGNDFYSLWLDETMSYSCAYFKDEEDSLYTAQVNKVHHILEKLYLKEGMSLLDIGCGWGFLLIEAAKKYKIKGVGITLSTEQHKEFNERIKKEHLEDYLRCELLDYRELEKSNMKFDRIVSVGMIEHVGREEYMCFMKNVHSVLKEKGLFLLHFISSLKESSGDPWIKKYIFPGGVIPSLREIINIMPDYNFYTLDVESLRRHYNLTLLKWRNNFLKHKDEIEKKMGIEFTRMWDLYLASCAAIFKNGVVDLHQILMSKGANNDLPLIRRI